ncbi:hypothetical protein vseg_017169 [Gypsophila vaccaria]
MESRVFLCILLACIPSILARDSAEATLVIDGSQAIAQTDEHYVCATLDWWPHTKCNYDDCPWGNSSILNLNVSAPLLKKAVKAFRHLRLRLGGTLEDQVVYDVPSLKLPCHPIRKQSHGLFNFSTGCLLLSRWDILNQFFQKTGALVTFGINALYGRQKSETTLWTGPWDSSNAHDFINYTISKGYQIYSWEFGNELSGSGYGARVEAAQYAKDVIKLEEIINELYKQSHSIPSLSAPGGNFDKDWFSQFLEETGRGVVNSVTYHIYNLGAGNDPELVSKMLDPTYLSRISETFEAVNKTVETSGPWAHVWIGESGGAYNSGGRLVSNTFVDSFWYLDQLGLAATYNTKVYCRQTLVGGNYGLLNTTTFAPNPDYYGALLWNRLMGTKVLHVDIAATRKLRSYAHCTKGRAGITVLLINLRNHTSFVVKMQNKMDKDMHMSNNIAPIQHSFVHHLKMTVPGVGSKASDRHPRREEYHLTAKDGSILSQTAFLNGKPLEITENGDIPRLEPALVSMDSPVYMSPLSIAFIVFPNYDAPACDL